MRFLLQQVAEIGIFSGHDYIYHRIGFHRIVEPILVAIILAGSAIFWVHRRPRFRLYHAILREAGAVSLGGSDSGGLVEALPAIVLGVVVLFETVDDIIAKASWLSAEEKAVVVAEISRGSHREDTPHHAFRVHQSPRVADGGPSTSVSGLWMICMGFWLPTMIRQTGVKDAFDVGFLASRALQLRTDFDDSGWTPLRTTRERRWHVGLPSIVAAVGFALCNAGGGNPILVAIFGMNMAVAGVVTAMPMFWALQHGFLEAQPQPPASL